ncbi:MAG: TolC family protein [Methylococcales bacterium]|jgi:hypothetical protein|nr:TolC family protein [Methylococcales bacterium]MBT3699681.1 TolC family protein [Methylococcales bacterium]MBT3816680.1 TolC family protein [Methylococcales bacterium]MBT4032715.1 TolC family protein [Methylococcales bacterium]MBT4347638.1 TolC family protein [Methylococcales bacterium]
MVCLGYLNRLFLLAIVSTVCLAESDFNDSFSLRYEKGLSLSTLVENTLAKSPDQLWLEALESEANALRKRSDSWVAGAASVALGYQEASSGTLHYIDGGVSVPLWHWGQQDAEALIADKAEQGLFDQAIHVKLQMAGLIRAVLWDLALVECKLTEAVLAVDFSEHILATAVQSVQLGELSHLDLLPVKSELLIKKSALLRAKVDLNKMAKRYQTITRSNVVPVHFEESRTELREIDINHSSLAFINSKITRKQAEYQALILRGSGQTTLSLGVNSDRGDARSNDAESFNIALNIPLGSAVHNGPDLAVKNIEINKLLADRMYLIRKLNEHVFEVSQNLMLGEDILVMAMEIAQLEGDRLKIAESSYNAGELSLQKFKSIQLSQQLAQLKVTKQLIFNKKNIALYNQSLGVLP